MGQSRHFRPGEKAPNNGFYVEIGDMESMVTNPKQVHLEAGQKFPDTTNHERIWTYKRKP